MNIIVATFTNDDLAIKGMHKLNELDALGDVTLYNNVLVKRGTDGTLEYLKNDRVVTGWNSLGGMLLGSAIGLIGGPVGVVAGLVGGLAVGSIADAVKYSFDYDFIDEVAKGVLPGTTCLIAEVGEPSPVFINNAFAPLGAVILRTNVYTEKDKYFQTQMDELDAEIAQSEADFEAAAAEQKAEIKAKIAKLRAKREAKVAEIKGIMQRDIDNLKSSVRSIRQQLEGKIDTAKRRFLEHELANDQEKIDEYEVRVNELNSEIAKIKTTAA